MSFTDCIVHAPQVPAGVQDDYILNLVFLQMPR